MERPDGTRVAEVRGLTVQRIDAAPVNPDSWCYGTRWDGVTVEDAPLVGRWVVMGDGAIADVIRAQLASRGADVAATEGEIAGVVVLVPADSDSAGATVRRTLDGVRPAMASGSAVWLVTRGAVRLGDEAIAPAQAAAWGLGRVAQSEYEAGTIHLVDLQLEGWDDELAALGRAIAADVRETQLAVRSSGLFAPRLLERAMPSAADYVPSSDGMHLITGGLGGVGLGLAGWLIGRGARFLTLVGRSAPSAATEAQLDAWHSAGVDVRVVSVDVSQSDAVEALLGRLAVEGPSLVGVYHAAGALVTGAIADLDDEALTTAMGAKADGAWHLHRLTQGLALEAFVLFGSASSTLGSRGQGAYAAANAYLGGLAQHRRANGLVATHIAWGPWAGVGMAAGEEAIAHLRSVGLAALPAEAAYGLLGRAIATGTTDVAVIDMLRDAYRAAWPRAAASPYLAGLFTELEAEAGDVALIERLGAMSDAERLMAVGTYLAEAVGAALGRSADDLDRACPLNALGMDSLMGMQVRNRVARDLGVAIAMMDLLKGPTIEELARLVVPKLSERELVAVVPQALSLETVLAEPERLLADMPRMSEGELDRWIEALERV
jgi:short-subunit dehydrogenase/aryl carrier-like protein